MVRVKKALISVSDKTGITEFAKGLHRLGIEILSTGGTASLLKESGIPVVEVSSYTGFPEMLDGRVKTLHPKIHGGLLALRDNPKHLKSLKDHSIGLIDMVVVNLYPFEKTIEKPNVTQEEAIENIDIGGPSMLRSAAKNFRFVAAVTSPSRYKDVLEELQRNACILSDSLLKSLAVDVFRLTSRYDSLIYEFLKGKTSGFPLVYRLELEKMQDLRYGENPHQKGAFYREFNKLVGLASARQLQGKELSFNNLLDLESAWNLVTEFKEPACVIVKHNNPCGAAEANTLNKAFKEAWASDKLSAFGGIIALNKKVNLTTARAVLKTGFIECIIAPNYDKGALKLFRQKKNIRVMELPDLAKNPDWDLKKVSGGMLVQEKDILDFIPEEAKIVTENKPAKKQWEALVFAWKVAKHTKSNAIILAKGTKTVGIGAGQMSRVDSVYIATKKAGSNVKGSVLASDAFFPKEDAVQLAIKAGVKAIIHPGGSIADEEIIKVAKKAKIVMVLTGMRHFKH